MKKLLLLLPFIMLIIIYWVFQRDGSDPTMDYSSLQGSGMSPQEYDALVKQRQAKYADGEDVTIVQ